MTDTIFSHVHGRRKGRPLNQSRQHALDDLYPKLAIPKDKLKEDGAITPASLFDKSYQQHWLEIGFGNGEHLHAIMEQSPTTAFIGAEPFINGMAAFLKSVHHIEDPNIRVYMDDALVLARSLAGASLDGIYILNPDPWPKARHNKRRIVRPDTLDIYARILKPGAQLIMTTDVDELAEWMCLHATQHPEFTWTAERADDWRTIPKNWPVTRYEQKGAEAGRKQSYLFFERV